MERSEKQKAIDAERSMQIINKMEKKFKRVKKDITPTEADRQRRYDI
ncbi:MAG: hypothetical protein GY928_16565 [Colwellia sp.]|nr:hypothetical protein [Colwellia sp.]